MVIEKNIFVKMPKSKDILSSGFEVRAPPYVPTAGGAIKNKETPSAITSL